MSVATNREIPFYQPSNRSVQFLQKLNLSKGCLHNELALKQIVAHLTMGLISHPYNAQLILNIHIPLAMHRSILMDKFRRLDHILSIIVQTPEPGHTGLLQRWKNCSYKDIVAHYTRYRLVAPPASKKSGNEEDHDVTMTDAHSDLSMFEFSRSPKEYVRANVLGGNSNLTQFLESVRDHLGCDHSHFLTTSPTRVTTADMDLLSCRFFTICEALVTHDFGAELLVDTTKFYTQILQYLYKFLYYCFEINQKKNPEFNGLTSDHLKLLLSGVVIMEIGLKKTRPITRFVLEVTDESNKIVELQLMTDGKPTIDFSKNKQHFKLSKKIVDCTPGAADQTFRSEIDDTFNKMYKAILKFTLTPQPNH